MSIDKANLLTHLDSFRWEDRGVDCAKMLDDLILAIDLASGHGDNLFSHPSCFDLQLGWGYFHELLYYTEDQVNQFVPWLRINDHQNFLINIWGRATTEEHASNLDELDIEFPDRNNGLFGCFTGQAGDKYVDNQVSWKKLHQDFVRRNPGLSETHPEYFKAFYVPGLTLPANQINTMIQRGQVHTIFKRLDTPTQLDEESTLHGEQIQMHFNDANDSALNIDGTWKHGGFVIPEEAREKLIEWGFLFPEDHS